MIPAKFGSKNFKVDSKTIYTPSDTAISESIDIEEKEVSGKKPATTVKGIKLQSLSMKVQLDARFVDVIAELRWWKNKLLSKKSEMFTLGSYKVGQFYLSQYDIAESTQNKNGEWLSATLTLTFTEDGTYANKQKTNFDKVATKKAAAVKSSKTTKSTKSKEIKIGTKVKPKKGTRWYYTAEGALKKTGKSGKAYNKVMTVSHIYQKGKAINPQGLGWMIPSDVDIV